MTDPAAPAKKPTILMKIVAYALIAVTCSLTVLAIEALYFSLSAH